MRQHFAFFKNHMVLHLNQGNARFVQCAAHGMVPRNRLRLVVFGTKHRIHLQRLGQRRNFAAGHAVQHDQPGLLMARNRAQTRIQFHQRFADKFHPAVALGQGLQNFAVKDEHAENLGALRQRVGQCRVIL